MFINVLCEYIHVLYPSICYILHILYLRFATKLHILSEFSNTLVPDLKSRHLKKFLVCTVADLYTAVGDNPKKESYVLWNLRGQYRIAKWVDVWVRGDNLLAQKYEINDGYPMPRATVMAGFNFHF